MAFTPTTWVDDVTDVDAFQMNRIEEGILEALSGTEHIAPSAAATPLTVRGAPSQSVPLMVVEQSSGADLLTVSATGELVLADTVVTANKVTFSATMWNPLVGDTIAVLRLNIKGRGVGASGEGAQGLSILHQDDSSVVNKTITGVASNGSGGIRITCLNHTFQTGDRIAIYGVGGVVTANGKWTVAVINANTFDLQGSSFSGTYTSGGTATNRPYSNAIFIGLSPTLDRGGLTGTAANADDLNGIALQNVSATAKATDGYHIATSPLIPGPAWSHAFSCDADLEISALQFTGDLTGSDDEGVNAAMVDLGRATASGGGMAIRLPNAVPVAGRNAANSADVWMFYLDTANALQLFVPLKIANGSSVTYGDDAHLNFGSSVGTRIGTSPSQKLAFYNATPIVQPTGVAVSAAGIHAALVSLGLIAA